MRSSTILLILAMPAGVLGYLVGVRITEALPLPAGVKEVVVLFGPLFIAGLCMLPFLVPFFDRKATEDLAAYRRSHASIEKDEDDDTGDPPG